MKNERMKKLGILLIGMMAMMTSCVQGDLYELYEEDEYPLQIKRTKWGNDTFYIPDNLIGSSGCGYKAIQQVIGSEYTLSQIKTAMTRYDSNVECFPREYLGNVIHDLTGQITFSISAPLSAGSVSTNDIICVSPHAFGDQAMTSGHASVVTNIVNTPFATIVYCYDGCYFYLNNIDYVVKTSLLAN